MSLSRTGLGATWDRGHSMHAHWLAVAASLRAWLPVCALWSCPGPGPLSGPQARSVAGCPWAAGCGLSVARARRIRPGVTLPHDDAGQDRDPSRVLKVGRVTR